MFAEPDYHHVLHDSFERTYHAGKDSWTAEPAMRRLVPMLCERLRPDSLILDVGAGRGRDTEFVLSRGHRVTAVDLVELPEWDGILRRWPGRVEHVVTDVRSLADEPRFDAVVDNGVLHHLRPGDYGPYLANLHRLLLTGGLLALSLFARAEGEAEGLLLTAPDGRLSREFTEAEAARLLTDNGLSVVASQRVQRRRPEWMYLMILARSTES